MSFTLLFKLAEQFAAPPVRLNAARCLNARHPQAACAQCAEICPTDAIRIVDGRPQLAGEKCVGCGVCLWACPVGAFEEARPPETWLLTTVAQQTGPVVLACPPAAPKAPPLPDGVTVRAPRCLAALSPAVLAELAEAASALWLADGACAECPLGALHASMVRAAQRANAWLALYRRKGRVRLFSQQQPPPSAAEVGAARIVDGSNPALDRRAFLRGKLRRKSVVGAQPVPVQAQNPVDARLDYTLPRERVRLLLLERAWPPPAERSIRPQAYGFAGIYIHAERCTLCGWCAAFCPTAALEWAQEGDTLRIVFQPLRCVDCNICQAACPVQAVEKMAQFPAGFLRDRLLLAEDTRQTCTRCGKPTGARHGALCVWCAQQNAPADGALDLPWEKLFPPPQDP